MVETAARLADKTTDKVRKKAAEKRGKKVEERVVCIVQRRSAIGRPSVQRDTLEALGVRRLGVPVVKKLTPSVSGMIAKVSHLVRVEERKK